MLKISITSILFYRFDNDFDQVRDLLLKKHGFDFVSKIDNTIKKHFTINKTRDYLGGDYFFKKIEAMKTYYQALNCRYQDYSLLLAYLDIVETNANNYFDGTYHARKGVTTPFSNNKINKRTSPTELSLNGLDFKPKRSKGFVTKRT